jgi:hypothetical protein
MSQWVCRMIGHSWTGWWRTYPGIYIRTCRRCNASEEDSE